jgi:hypothetical protein
LDPQVAARAFYEPLAIDETRRAVARYLDAVRRYEEGCQASNEVFRALGAEGTPLARLDTFRAALGCEARNAEAHLIRLLVAWDERAVDRDADCAEQRYWPPRGAIVDGVVYLATPADPGECAGLQPGERPDKAEGTGLENWAMKLHAFPVASLVNLDAKPNPACDDSAQAPFQVIYSDGVGLFDHYDNRELSELVEAEAESLAKAGPDATDLTVWHNRRVRAVIRRAAGGRVDVVRMDDEPAVSESAPRKANVGRRGRGRKAARP